MTLITIVPGVYKPTITHHNGAHIVAIYAWDRGPSSILFRLPRKAVKNGCVHKVLPLQRDRGCRVQLHSLASHRWNQPFTMMGKTWKSHESWLLTFIFSITRGYVGNMLGMCWEYVGNIWTTEEILGELGDSDFRIHGFYSEFYKVVSQIRVTKMVHITRWILWFMMAYGRYIGIVIGFTADSW